MPLPLKTYRVLPNPWALIHPEKGPVGTVPKAAREDSPLRFVGAERVAETVEKRPKNDPRGDRVDITFRFPKLDAALLKGEPEVVSAVAPDGHYYRDRLVDGSLIPGDEATASAAKCRFGSLEEAKKAGVAVFDADHGEGSWLELEKLLADQAKASAREEKAGKGAVAQAPTTTDKKAGS